MGLLQLHTGFRWLEETTEKSRAATFAKFMNGPVVREVQGQGDPPPVGVEIDFADVGKNLFPDPTLSAVLADPFNEALSYISWPIAGTSAVGTGALFPTDVLLAVPDEEVAGSILRAMKPKKVTSAQTVTGRYGLYDRTTFNGGLYPGNLIGQVEFTNPNERSPIVANANIGGTQILSNTLFPYTIPSRDIYFHVLCFSVMPTSGLALINATETARGRFYLGYIHHSATQQGEPIVGFQHAFPYAALPATFPTSAPALLCPFSVTTSAPWFSKVYQPLS